MLVLLNWFFEISIFKNFDYFFTILDWISIFENFCVGKAYAETVFTWELGKQCFALKVHAGPTKLIFRNFDFSQSKIVILLSFVSSVQICLPASGWVNAKSNLKEEIKTNFNICMRGRAYNVCWAKGGNYFCVKLDYMKMMSAYTKKTGKFKLRLSRPNRIISQKISYYCRTLEPKVFGVWKKQKKYIILMLLWTL